MGLNDVLRKAKVGQATEPVKGGPSSAAFTATRKLYKGVVEAVDRFLVRRENAPSQRETGVWHPSELNDVCGREHVLAERHPTEMVEESEGIDTVLMRIFDLGHAMHAWWQESYLGPAGVLYGTWECSRCRHHVVGVMPKTSCPVCQGWSASTALTPKVCRKLCADDPESESAWRLNEEKQSERGGCVHCGLWGSWHYLEPKVSIPELNIAGRTDGLLVEEGDDQPEDVRAIFELKTMNMFSFQSLLAPLAAHMKQATIYAVAKSKEYPNLKHIVFVYMNKNGGDVKQFIVDIDPSLVAEEFARIQEAHDSLKNGKTPKRLVACKNVKSARAKDCQARFRCFASEV